MKLTEALLLRADIQKKLESLREELLKTLLFRRGRSRPKIPTPYWNRSLKCVNFKTGGNPG